MIKNTVINAELGYALATARHKDAIVICDAICRFRMAAM